jgi:predicted AAA+ superfamily ATPase
MRIIERNYLQVMINVMGTPDIKVITGVRRSGKSELLNMFINYIKKTDKKANIIFVDFNLDKYDELKQYKEFIKYVYEKYDSKKNNYLMVDEVQMCNGFEKAINNFHAEEKYDIYITGSNAFLLSSDLATLFTGRTYSIEVFPFSYKEYLEYYKMENTQDNFERYVLEGGFSGSYLYKEIDKKYNYIRDVYKTMIVRDIVQRNRIQNIPLLDSISDFLIDNISRLTSYRSVTNTLNSNKANTNDKTVGSYIKFLCEAFAFYKVRRYDIQGKRYLASQDKYYLSDHAVKYAIEGTKNMNYGSIYENIVAMELIRRGYEIYVGTLYDKKIDFVAKKRNEQLYIQVSSDIGDDFENDTFRREVDPLLKIKDAYPKIVIAKTHHSMYTYEGIQIIDIKDWLIK